MKNVPEVKMGIVVGSTDWLPSDVAIQERNKLITAYKESFGEDGIYECPICITDNEISIKRALKDLAKAECNAVCLYFANYGPESSGTLFAKEFHGPVMFFADSEEGHEPFEHERKDALSGFINACYALNLRETKVYIPSKPVGTYCECAEMVHEFFPIARTQIAVKDLKIISFGPRPSSYLAAYAENHLLYSLGVEIAEFSELELFESYRKHEKDSRIPGIVSEMELELGANGNPYPGILANLAQYEITVNDWIRNYKGNKKYVALSSTCWPAFPVSFGFVPCYVNSRITGKGIPVACEVDVYGAVSEYLGQCVSDDVVTILNINNNVPQTVYEEKIKNQRFCGKEYSIQDLFVGYHCGVTSSKKMTSCKLDYHFVNKQLIGETQSNGTIQGQVVPGAVTIFRLQGSTDGKIRAYVAQGQVLPVSMETYGGFGIIAIPEMERFCRNVVIEKNYPNHATVIFGHHGKKLVSILKLMGIEEIDYNHPKTIPYPNENGFNLFPDWF